ncbi:MAG: purine-binding chemotaxis protein CheW [Opitutales bacterium]|nr:purine-binding chemotaxis protein CheW [Opitutales bacterium]
MATSDVESGNAKTKFEAGKFLTFKLGEESYGVAVLKIREIIRMQKITPVPQMPHHVKGVINLRGKVIPVIDMRLKFGIGEDTVTERTCIVVVQIEAREGIATSVGLIVDAVEEVMNITEEEVEETPDLGGQFDGEYILGIAKIKGEVKTLLDIDQVIMAERLNIR